MNQSAALFLFQLYHHADICSFVTINAKTTVYGCVGYCSEWHTFLIYLLNLRHSTERFQWQTFLDNSAVMGYGISPKEVFQHRGGTAVKVQYLVVHQLDWVRHSKSLYNRGQKRINSGVLGLEHHIRRNLKESGN